MRFIELISEREAESAFADSFQEKPEVINLNSIDIKGACLGCMKCGFDYNCHYNDGFKEFYNTRVRGADILVFAGTMTGRYEKQIDKLIQKNKLVVK